MFRPLALVFACLLPAAAFAEGDPSTPPPAAADPAAEVPPPGAHYAPVTRHIFDGEDVEGRTRNPDGAWVEGHAGTPAASLIRIRTTFRAELLQSAQDI